MQEDDPISDTNLARLSAGGCEESFRALFDRYYETIHAYAWKLCCNAATADDIAQQTFIKVAGALPKQTNHLHFKPWLYKIALNTARDHLRSTSRYRERIQQLEVAQPGLDTKRTEYDEIAHLLGTLPDSLRETILLVCVQGLTQKEAAEVLNCPEGTVAWRISEARKTLTQIKSS